jgi:hypothetical protein
MLHIITPLWNAAGRLYSDERRAETAAFYFS